MSAKNLMKDINIHTKWQDMTLGAAVIASGNSIDFKTGDWRNFVPTWNKDKCIHCFLCVPTCPDSSIPVKDGKRLDFDFDFCKGCGVCYKTCPEKIGAITFGEQIY